LRLEELYRRLIYDFIILYSYKLKESDFILKEETSSANRKGKRQYLNDEKTNEFIKKLNTYFLTVFEIPRINIGKKQELESLISEGTSLFAIYLPCERPTWIPTIAELK
jgi:hypothetical protein